jgi:hypothetical protein
MGHSDESLKESDDDDSFGVKKNGNNSFENDFDLIKTNGRSFGRSGSFKGDENNEIESPDPSKQERNISTNNSSKNAEPASIFKSAKKIHFSKPYDEHDNISAFRPLSQYPGGDFYGIYTVDE